MQANMRTLVVRYIVAMLLLLFAVQGMAKRDSMLWVGIKNTGVLYQQGRSDSTLAMAKRLLITAESQNDDLAQASLLNVIGICLNDKGDKQGAREAFARCISISEANGYLQQATKTSNSFLIRMMVPAYAQMVLNCRDAGLSDKAAEYAKRGMEWIPICNIPKTKVAALDAFAETLMDYKEYGLIYDPMRQGVRDALQQGQADIAMMLISYLIKIEYTQMHKRPEDIPWIKAGEALLSDVKTETARSAFIAATKLILPQTEETDLATNSPKADDSISAKQSDPALTDSAQTHVEYEYIKVRNERIGIIGAVLAVVLIVFVIYILWQRDQRRKTAQKAEQQMNKRYREGQELERSRLAKELHDGVSNQLLAIEMKLNEDGLTPQTMQLLSESREQVRRVSHGLIPPEFEHTTLDEVVGDYAASLSGLHQCEVVYTSTPADADWTIIPQATALEIYRIIQEMTGNALKHSGATTITIGMHLDKSLMLTTTINDNGSWKDEEKRTDGIGTRTVSERAASIGGKIDLYRHQFGNTVKLVVKLPESAK